MAARSFWYSAAPDPTLTSLTLTFGYFFSNRSTSFCRSGTQLQKVSVVSVFIASSIWAWVAFWAAGGAVVVPPLPPPQAARARPPETPAAAPRNRRRVNGLVVGMHSFFRR